jgi:hypothetical protein
VTDKAVVETIFKNARRIYSLGIIQNECESNASFHSLTRAVRLAAVEEAAAALSALSLLALVLPLVRGRIE